MNKNLYLVLAVDKEANRVLWAESGGDVVDVLLSFLTLPLGTVVRVLGKQTGLGCVDELYKSVEALDESCFQAPCCKNMLLHPRNAADRLRGGLPVKVDDGDLDFYTCWDKNCIQKKYPSVFSSVLGARCGCQGAMDRPVTWRPGTSTEGTDGVFVDRGRRFYISDDLHISPAATIGNSLLQRTGLKESQLEHRKVEISRERVLTLLQKSLTSKAPLTEMFLQKSECLQPKQVQLHHSILSTTEEAVTAGCAAGKQFKARLVKNKARNEVMYAEIGGNTLDLLFSFLTIPLGSILRLMMGKNGSSPVIGCMDNLYQSVEKLCATKYCAYNKLEKHILRDMLMAPKIATHFGCSNQLLDVVEEMSFETTMNPCVCRRCAEIPPPACIHGKGAAQIAVQINPKLGNGCYDTAGSRDDVRTHDQAHTHKEDKRIYVVRIGNTCLPTSTGPKMERSLWWKRYKTRRRRRRLPLTPNTLSTSLLAHLPLMST